MCNMLNIMAIDTFLKPAINRLLTYSKDFRLFHGVLLGGAIVRVRGRDKKSAGSIYKNKKSHPNGWLFWYYYIRITPYPNWLRAYASMNDNAT